MKKTLLIGALALLSVFLFCQIFAVAGDHVQEQRYDVSSQLLEAPVSTAPVQDINIEIDEAALTRPYDATQLRYPVFTSDIAEPRVEYLWFQRRGDEYVAIDAPPTFVGDYRVTVRVTDEMEYAGEDTADFSITPAVFHPGNARFQYTGASVFSVAPVSACGTDMIGYEVAFQSGNVGAEVSYVTLRGDHAENYRISEDFRATIFPVSVDLSQAGMISAQKTYDATDLLSYTFDASTLPGILRGDSATAVFSTGVFDVCDAAVLSASAVNTENSNYLFFGEVKISLRVTKAVFTPPCEVAYSGSSTVTLIVPTGLGEDMLALTLVFEDAAAGSCLTAGGVSFAGVAAKNYALAQGYTAQIVPMRLDLGAVGILPVQKRFDGTNQLSVSLSADRLPGIASGEVVLLSGTVSQIYPCEDVIEVLRSIAFSNPNYILENELTVSLTVQKALLQFVGSPELAYNGYAERILQADSAYVKGLVVELPVVMTAVFESGTPGARLLRVVISGEYSEIYEVDDTAFTPVIKTATLGFATEELSFVANGSDTRVLRAGSSVFLSAAVQSDDVCVVLKFSSPEAGAELVSVTLIGADAHKYVLDVADFSAVIE